MFKNNLKSIWRHFVRDKQFTILNLAGLSTGLACAILIYLWVLNERSMDKFHAKDQRLYQVMSHIKLPDGIHTQENAPWLLAPALAREFPEIEEAVSVQPIGQGILFNGEENSKVDAEYADKDFFKVFSYRLLQGDPNEALANMNNILLSDELAIKLFHTTTHVIGKTLQWGYDRQPCIVAGIFERPPAASSARFDLLLPYMKALREKGPEALDWQNSYPSTYIVVKAGADMDRLGSRLSGFLRTKSKDSPLSLTLRKYSDQYLYNKYENGVQAGGRIEYVRIFPIIAVFILVIACINFMNLSTAGATKRMKEIGVKKVIGARRSTLVLQYLSESLLMAFLSLVLALSAVVLLMPGFNAITGKQIGFHVPAAAYMNVLGITVLTGLLAGSYPALYLSGFTPVSVLKGRLSGSIREGVIRKGLVVFQFTLSCIFIISVWVIYKQMRVIETIHLGYNKDHIISFRKEGALGLHFDSFMSEAGRIPGVLEASSFNGDLVGHSSGNTEKMDWEGRPPGLHILINALDVGYGLTDLMGMEMAEGRSFSRAHPSDSLSMILNEAAIKAMGLKDPIGKTVKVWGGVYRIIGVVKDFHFESLYERVKPCFLRCITAGNNIVVRLAAGHERTTLAALGKLYREYNLGVPFGFSFLDQDYEAMYVSEQRTAVLSRWFAGLTVLISCLGLFGLAAFTARKRQKEIGIRKAIGASAGRMMGMLLADFMKPVAVSLLIAFPLAWWIMNGWLEKFAYHTHIDAIVFLAAFGIMLLISLLTIGVQSFKSAVANPVKSLRTD